MNTGEIEGGFSGERRQRRRERVHRRRRATNSLIDGRSRAEHRVRVPAGSAGQDERHHAEYGGALGGVISAVTKSGGNTFRGEGHYYYIGNGLSAGTDSAPSAEPDRQPTVFHLQDDKQTNNRNEFGGSLGGPIVKNKLFFFGSCLAAARPPHQQLPVLERHRARARSQRPER